MDRNEVSKQVTEPQRKFLQQLEYCLCKVSDYMLLDFKIAYEELQLGNVRFIDDNLVLLDVRLPYTVEDVAVFFDADDCSGWATIRFVFSKEKQYAEYDITGYVGDTKIIRQNWILCIFCSNLVVELIRTLHMRIVLIYQKQSLKISPH